MTWAQFKIAELRLDQLNYRTGPQKTQRDAIRAIIADQEMKLANHARHILKHGLNPGEPTWVVREDDAYVVVEGNRRLAALKLMENPEIAEGTVVERAFRELSAQFKEHPIRELEARVYPSRKDVAEWIGVRHMSPASGVGLQPWKHSAKSRATEAEGGSSLRHLIVRDWLEDESEEWAAIATTLDSKWTTVDRVLNARPMTDLLGVNINKRTRSITFENGDEVQGRRLLSAILSEMASASFDFSKVEKKEDRESFLARFVNLSVKVVPAPPSPSAASTPMSQPVPPAPTPTSVVPPRPTGAVPPATPVTAPIVPPPKSVRPMPHHGARSTLAPQKGPSVFKVSGTRLNPLYEECRYIEVSGNENAAAFLLRVFIELSSEELLVRRNVPIPANLQAKGKADWDAIGIKLTTKVNCVADFLDPSQNGRAFQQARLLSQEASRGPAAVWTLHGYFHNRQLVPLAADIKGAWDAWESYLREVHANLQQP